MIQLIPGLLTASVTMGFELIDPVVTRFTFIHVGDITNNHKHKHKKVRS